MKIMVAAILSLVLCNYAYCSNLLGKKLTALENVEIDYKFRVESGQDYIKRDIAQKVYFTVNNIPQKKLHLSVPASEIIYPTHQQDFFTVYYKGNAPSITIAGRIKLGEDRWLTVFEKEYQVH
jgi:hypothetical protein